jgi:acyl-CoA reductase LuxC
MKVERILPSAGWTTAADLETTLRSRPPQLQPFAPEILEFVSGFSRSIFQSKEAAGYPELTALAFWMRKAELQRLSQDFENANTRGVMWMPRGVVLHFPPANVDTIFVYSWLLATLTGNRSILRLSTRSTPQANLLCDLLGARLECAGPELKNSITVLRYGHDSDITAELSAMCDVRVIWGGNAAVAAIRGVPLPYHAKEIAFPDRSSLAVLDAEQYLSLEETQSEELAHAFYNDVFWFDQMACSSPRQLVWVGKADRVKIAARQFIQRLSGMAESRGYSVAAGAWLQKLVFTCRAILEQPVASVVSNQTMTVVELEQMASPPEEHCGSGLLFQVRADSLLDLAPHLHRRDQTLSYFGFSEDQLRALATALGGRAIDRIVPIGRALDFHRYWDGYDLVHEFTRAVWIEPGPGATRKTRPQ